ncbi:MAG: hydrolase [Bacteroidetes bacterium]|nr:hydrolase [Bacteroidota bacterium]
MIRINRIIAGLVSVFFVGLVTFTSYANAQSLSDKTTCLSRAQHVYRQTWDLYRVRKYHGLFLEYYPRDTAGKVDYVEGSAVKVKEVSFLWPFSGMMSATNALLHNRSVRREYVPYLDSLVIGMEAYKDTSRVPPGYQAYPPAMEKSDRYYDDNGLVGIEYAEAYLNTKDPRYLERAKVAFKFITSGWTNELGGGVYWLEGHHDQKPACSNGMAMLVALKLYEATGDKAYLEWGERFYNWMLTTLKAPNGLFYNDKKVKDGAINPTFWTYNTGSVIEAAVLLYRFTKKKEYLHEAQDAAKSAFDYYHSQPHDTHLMLKVDLPWFVTVLFRGYEALYKVDKNSKYINAIHHDLDYAWQYSRDKNGFLTHDWSANKNEIAKRKWLLDEACIAELYARLSEI